MIIKRKNFFEHTYLKGFFLELLDFSKKISWGIRTRPFELENKNYPKVTFYRVCTSCKINQISDLEGDLEEFKCHFCEGFCPTGALSSRNLEFNIPENTLQ